MITNQGFKLKFSKANLENLIELLILKKEY